MKQIRQSLPKEKSKVSSFWVRLWVREFSYLVTWLCLRLGISANTVSVLSAIDAFAGCVLLCVPNFICMLVGVVLINFWIVLDCVDGNIARVLKKDSRSGEFFDAVSGYVVCAFAFFAVGVAAYHTSDWWGEYQYLFIVFGALASITDLYARLIYQKYTVTRLSLAQKNGVDYRSENDNFEKKDKPKGLTYVRLVIDRQTGISALFMPALIVSFVFRRFEFMVLFYCLYHCAAFLYVFVSFLHKATKLDRTSNDERV